MTSIRQRLTRSLLLTLGLILTAGLAAIFFEVRRELTKSFDRTLLAKAQAISTLVLLDQERVTLNFSDKFMRGFDEDVGREFYEIWREDGVSVQRSESLATGHHLENRAGTFQKPAKWKLTLPNGKPGRALGVEFVPRGTDKASTRSNRATFHLVVAATSEGLTEDLWEIFLVTLIGGLAMIVLTAVLVPWMLRSGLKPLEQLADEVEKINADTLTVRLPAGAAPKELVAITTRLNALLARLELSFERERRVSAAMAHELRTPIAELRSLAESAIKWPDARDPETDRDALAIAQQMETLVTHLLALARSESGQLSLQTADVDLAAAVAQAWKPLATRAEERRCPVKLELDSVTVATDSVLLRAILNNLLENAVEYCPAGGAIGVTLRRTEGANFLLTIANPAPDFTPADTAQLFERFWRKEQARSGGVHAGLGLSLVKSFAGILGWEITARLEPAGVLTLALSPRLGIAGGTPAPRQT